MDQQRREWTTIFLQSGGFKYVLGLFNAKVDNLVAAEAYELIQIQFYVTLLSVFLNSAFGTGSTAALKLTSQAEKQQILDSLDFSQLQSNVLGLVAKIVAKEAFLSEDKMIVENCLALWSGCVVNKPELYNQFKAWKNQGDISDSKEFILKGLLKCPEEKIRIDFQACFDKIVKQTTDSSRCVFLLGLLAS